LKSIFGEKVSFKITIFFKILMKIGLIFFLIFFYRLKLLHVKIIFKYLCTKCSFPNLSGILSIYIFPPF